jgi:hypothetical protein
VLARTRPIRLRMDWRAPGNCIGRDIAHLSACRTGAKLTGAAAVNFNAVSAFLTFSRAHVRMTFAKEAEARVEAR